MLNLPVLHISLLHASLPHGATLNHWVPTLASLLIAVLWQSVALTLFAGCALRLLPGISSAARSHVWTAVLVLMAALPLAVSFPAHPGSPHPAVWHAGQRLSFAMVAIWLAAAACRLAQLLASAASLHRTLRRAKPASVLPGIAALLHEGPRAAILCTSPDVDRPSVAGFFRPRILLPPDLLASLDEAELRHLLLHEREHLRRRDDWINLLGQLSLVLFPLSPALLWLNHRLAVERELACDDGVLRNTGARKTYAACLARVAESSLLHRGLSLALGVLGPWHRRPELSRRVERILAAPPQMLSPGQIRLATGILCAGLLGGTALLAHSPELVSFASASGLSSSPAGNMASQADPARMSRKSMGFTGEGIPAPMLVKAVMPQPPRSPTLLGRAPSPVRLRKTIAARHRSTPPAVSLQRVDWARVAVSGPENPSIQAGPVLLQLTPINLDSSQVWYTAVRWGGSWILIQI